MERMPIKNAPLGETEWRCVGCDHTMAGVRAPFRCMKCGSVTIKRVREKVVGSIRDVDGVAKGIMRIIDDAQTIASAVPKGRPAHRDIERHMAAIEAAAGAAMRALMDKTPNPDQLDLEGDNGPPRTPAAAPITLLQSIIEGASKTG